MNFAQDGVTFLVEQFPTELHRDRLILYLRTLPLSGYLKRQYLRHWADAIGYHATSDDFKRADGGERPSLLRTRL